MKKKLLSAGVFLFGLLAGIGTPQLLTADTQTTSGGILSIWRYDDLPSDVAVPNGYQGFNWENATTYDYASYYSNYNNTMLPTLTATNVAYNTAGNTVVVTSASGNSFNFNGEYFSGWTVNNAETINTARTVTITGYNNSVLVGSFDVPLTLNAWTYSGNYGVLNGVTQVTIAGDGGRTFVMDTVPEPSTFLLVGVGTMVAGYIRSRKVTMEA